MNMKLTSLRFGLLFLFLLLDIQPNTPLGLVVVGDAQAIIGRPLTPVSGAGVARRTTRRVVVAESASSANAANEAAAASASASASAAQASAAAAEASAASAAPAPSGTAVPVGTIIPALPAGCVSKTINNSEYFDCAGTYYKPAFESNNLVYVVSQP